MSHRKSQISVSYSSPKFHKTPHQNFLHGTTPDSPKWNADYPVPPNIPLAPEFW